MFPKSSSGTSGKRRENKVNNMAEDGVSDAMLRENLKDIVRHLKNGVYLSCMADSAYAQAIIWASERIAELESQKQSMETGSDQVRGLFFQLDGCETTPTTCCEAVAWGQDRIKKLELENENLSKTILTMSKSPQLASPESEQEIYERRRRERLLDEITLSCVRGLLHGDAEEKTYEQIGDSARDRAEDICHGIKKYDAA